MIVGSASTISRTSSGVFPSTLSTSHCRFFFDMTSNCVTSVAVIAPGFAGAGGVGGAVGATAAGAGGGIGATAGGAVVGWPSGVRRSGRRCCPAASSSCVVGARPASRITSLVAGSSAPITSASPSGCAAFGSRGLPNRSVSGGRGPSGSASRISICSGALAARAGNFSGPSLSAVAAARCPSTSATPRFCNSARMALSCTISSGVASRVSASFDMRATSLASSGYGRSVSATGAAGIRRPPATQLRASQRDHEGPH